MADSCQVLCHSRSRFLVEGSCRRRRRRRPRLRSSIVVRRSSFVVRRSSVVGRRSSFVGCGVCYAGVGTIKQAWTDKTPHARQARPKTAKHFTSMLNHHKYGQSVSTYAQIPPKVLQNPERRKWSVHENGALHVARGLSPFERHERPAL